MSMELKNIPSQNQDDKSFKGIEKSDSYDSSVQDADVVAAESAKPVARLEVCVSHQNDIVPIVLPVLILPLSFSATSAFCP